MAQCPDTLVFSGGGALGVCHVGFLMSLKEHNVDLTRIKTVIGTSVGSIVALFFALGFSMEYMKDIFFKMDTSLLTLGANEQTVSYCLFEHFGLESGEYFRAFVMDILMHNGYSPLITLKQLWEMTKIDLGIATVDINQGTAMLLNHQCTPDMYVVDAVIASCAIPLFVQPVKYKDMLLVDGGIHEKLAMSLLKQAYPDASWIGSYLCSWKQFTSICTFTDYTKQLMYCVLNRKEEQNYKNVVYIDCSDYSSVRFDYDRATKEKLVCLGKEYTDAFLQQTTLFQETKSD